MFLTHLIAFLAILVATHVDIRIREVPDWISYTTIISGLLIGLLTSVLTLDLMPLGISIAGAALGFGIGLMMHYTGQWGGGDAKLLTGLGALFGLSRVFVNFLLLLVVAGAVYGLLYSIGLAIKHRKALSKAFKEYAYTPVIKRIRLIFQGVVLVALLLAFFVIDDTAVRVLLVLLCAGAYLLFYAWLLAKLLEQTCMKKRTPVAKLVEGDWILEEIRIGRGKKILPIRSGISKEDIAALKESKVKNVLVKEGIPFVPSFLIAYVLLVTLLLIGFDLTMIF